MQRAFGFLLAKITELRIGRDLDTSDLHVELIDLLANRDLVAARQEQEGALRVLNARRLCRWRWTAVR